jgi:uncharacterized membrane protein (Fun14 family)
MKGDYMVGSETQASTSWIAKLKSVLHLDNFTTNRLIEVGMYLGLGLLIGYALKRFSGAFITIVLTLLGLFLLHQFQIINLSFNVDTLRECFGLVSTQDSTLLYAYWNWVKAHVILVLSFFIGFLIGIRLG